MRKVHPTSTHMFPPAIRKFFVSGFVIFAFGAYALHEHGTDSSTVADALPNSPQPTPAQATAFNNGRVNNRPPRSQPQPVQPTAVPMSSVNGQFRDGTYQGAVADAFFGMVQVQAVVQNGKLSDVQFLDYPHDRRTSQRINSFAMPYLTTEAIQAQSARVDIISGATLTSEAFIQSLQSALNQAQS